MWCTCQRKHSTCTHQHIAAAVTHHPTAAPTCTLRRVGLLNPGEAAGLGLLLLGVRGLLPPLPAPPPPPRITDLTAGSTLLPACCGGCAWACWPPNTGASPGSACSATGDARWPKGP